MSCPLTELFSDDKLVSKIKRRLPHLFQLAELESSRAGKIGMEVGSLRERILVALLIHKFGSENVETDFPITEPEVDAKVFGFPVSIKTITRLGGVKLIWTVDSQKAREFRESYIPKCEILLANIEWGGMGGLFYIPLNVQKGAFNELGREGYIRLPVPGTNPRGVELSKGALLRLVNSRDTKSIEIRWNRTKIDFDPYRRWLDYWAEE